MNRLWILFVSVLSGIMVVTATAQQTETVTLPLGHAMHAWEAVANQKPTGKLIVVTVSQPGVRHNCDVESVSEERILCKGKFGHTASYRAEDVAALLNPAVHERIWPAFLGVLSVGGGLIAAACFVASLWGAVPLAILGTILVLGSPMVGIGAGNNDSPETVYYQRSGTSLSIKLR